MSRVLLIDPDVAGRQDARVHLERAGFVVFEAADAFTAELLLADMAFDVVVGDAHVQEPRLLDLVAEAAASGEIVLLILLTAAEPHLHAPEAVGDAAFDYLQRPVDPADLTHRVSRAVEFKRLHYEAQSLRGERGIIYQPDGFVGESAAVQQVFDLVSRVALSDSSVLLTGETGTGKELIAGAIHYNSPRSQRAFVKVNCAALPDELLASELFGHEKGAFTGAVERRIGRFEQADGGSIFLDEIGDMSLLTQAKVLRVTQEREFERLGGTKTISCDVRIISATNKNLAKAIEEGTFRQDLYYRINVVSIKLPPLRDRGDDVVLLAYYFLRKFAADLKKRVKKIHPEALELLKNHSFPGNVRELQNTIERAVLMTDHEEITPSDLDISFSRRPVSDAASPLTIPPSGIDLSEIEKLYILEALRLCDWNQKRAARMLTLTPRALNYKIKKHGITHLTWSTHRPPADQCD